MIMAEEPSMKVVDDEVISIQVRKCATTDFGPKQLIPFSVKRSSPLCLVPEVSDRQLFSPTISLRALA
jgi:hypothetical protein